MRYWWVNQNQTYENEVRGGFLWSPKTRSDGAKNQFYDNMRRVAVGDVVFSFCDARIKAVGIALGLAENSQKPEFGKAGAGWSTDGWLVPVAFKELVNPPRPKDHIERIRPHLPDKYAPLQQSGDGLQSVYLAEVPADMARVLIELIGADYFAVLDSLKSESDESESIAEAAEEAIRGRIDIGPTLQNQLIKSRRGQGVFRANVQLNETKCRVTGVKEIHHLRASHIKPWAKSTDEERLNGCNGLLLAPHVDYLFDKGLISFTATGDLLVSSRLEKYVLERWGIPTRLNVGQFNSEQAVFLEYHRTAVFKA